MGNNINQIAKVINSIHTVQKDDIEQIQEMQSDIQQMQSELWQAIRDL